MQALERSQPLSRWGWGRSHPEEQLSRAPSLSASPGDAFPPKPHPCRALPALPAGSPPLALSPASPGDFGDICRSRKLNRFERFSCKSPLATSEPSAGGGSRSAHSLRARTSVCSLFCELPRTHTNSPFSESLPSSSSPS